MLDPVEIALEGDRELTHCSNFVGDTYRVPLSFPPAKRAPKGLLRLHYNGSSPYLLTCRTSSPKMTRRMLRLSSKDAEAKETKAIAAPALRKRRTKRRARDQGDCRRRKCPLHRPIVCGHARPVVYPAPPCPGGVSADTVVLDDQLVQSDEMRMQWFRALLYEKPVSSRSSCLPAGGLFSSRRAGSR
jgi:hypothetical protein